ncbi:MAG: sensor histidine kinase [Bacteroidetes bacterium]|nr:sensor histidine kinase [Bacteroidota bacterium]
MIRCLLSFIVVLIESAFFSLFFLTGASASGGSDTSLINFLNEQSSSLYRNNPELARKYADSALTLSEKINFKKGLGEAYQNIGIAFDMHGYCDSAISYFLQSLKIFETNGNLSGQSASLNNIGEANRKLGRYGKALEYHFRALKIRQGTGDKGGMASSFNNIGNIYSSQGNFNKAVEYLLKSLQLREESGNKQGIAISSNNIGNVYYAMGNFDKAMEYYLKSFNIKKEIGDKHGLTTSGINIGNVYEKRGDPEKAIEYYRNALAIQEEIGDKHVISASLNNIGELYRKLGELDKANEYYKKSLVISESVGDKKSIALGLVNIAIIHSAMKKYKEALPYLEKGLSLSDEVGEKILLKHCYDELARVYAGLNDYKKAYQYNTLCSSVKDSLMNEETTKQIAEMQEKYQSEKKEKEIELLEKQKKLRESDILQQGMKLKQNRIINFGLVIGLITIVLTFVLIYIISRIKQKELLNRELIKKEKQNIRNIIEVQENERKRIAKDLHDGIGQTLAGLKISLNNLSGMPQSAVGKDEIFSRSIRLIDNACNEVRNISHQMLPRVLSEMGLCDAMKDLLDISFSGSKIMYAFEKHNITRMDEYKEVGIFRIFQELLSNIIKHSGATEISVHLHILDGTLILIVEDNGCGPGQFHNRKKGMGLLNITTRVEAMNGIFSLQPGPEKGTIANVRIPL